MSLRGDPILFGEDDDPVKLRAILRLEEVALVRTVSRRVWFIVLSAFITSGLVWSTGCQVAQEEEMITVGVVNFVTALEPTLDGFKAGMKELGYVEGQNITYIYDGPPDKIEELDEIARSFVESQVDLIFSISTPATQAAQRAIEGTDIPVVFAPVTDPVGIGLVTTLRNPEGNITGVTNLGSESLRMEWLIKLDREIEKIYIPYNSDDRSATASLDTAYKAAQELGLELVERPATDVVQMTMAIAEMPDDVDAIFILPDSLALENLQGFVDVAIERKLPLSGPTTKQVKDGALVSYGLDLESAGEQAARLADQILDGTDPGVLPVEEAVFFLAINLKTARAINLVIPDEILNQADVIIPLE